MMSGISTRLGPLLTVIWMIWSSISFSLPPADPGDDHALRHGVGLCSHHHDAVVVVGAVALDVSRIAQADQIRLMVSAVVSPAVPAAVGRRR